MIARTSTPTSPRPAARAAAAVGALAVWCSVAPAQLVLDSLEGTEGVDVLDRRGEQLPLDLEFRNAAGRTVTLGDYFDDGKPVLIVPAYFDCPMLCSLVMGNVQDSINEMSWTAGDQFRVLTFSFDHRDNPAKAKNQQDLALFGYREIVDDPSEAWPHLVCDAQTAKTLCTALGYHYKYLPETGEFSHDAAIFFIRPSGVVNGYIHGLEYPPRDLTMALSDAADGKTSSLFERMVFSCFRYDPQTGEYKVHPMSVMRIATIGTAVVVGALVAALFVGERVRRARALRASIREDIGL